ncbi:MAG: hypothetical protein GY788_28330 [bacterium]|nr:hypothetical protein [bacterium]
MSLIELTTTRHRLTAGVMAVAASVLLSGCPVQEPADGDFPKLEAALASIDWVGDGSVPPGVEIRPGGALPIMATFGYASPDAAALQLEIENRLKSFDTVFTLTGDSIDTASFSGDNWEVHVSRRAQTDGTPIASIWVETVADDDAAVESLAPIIEVLGTVP